MKKQRQDEQHALQRILYLLGENSIQHLSETDDQFASIIADIYDRVDHHAQHLTAA